MITSDQVGLLDNPVCGPGLASIRMGRWDEDIGAGREDLWGNGKEGVFPQKGEYLGIDERGVVSGPVAIPSLDVIGECTWRRRGRSPKVVSLYEEVGRHEEVGRQLGKKYCIRNLCGVTLNLSQYQQRGAGRRVGSAWQAEDGREVTVG
jgi:hypothetical protein